MKLFRRINARQKQAVKRIDQYQEAISFAQAGAADEALEALQAKQDSPAQENNTLLVLAQGDTFPEDIREYALEMAQRLGYTIIALNTAPVKREAWRFFHLEGKKLRQEFTAAARENFAVFQQEAEACKVPIVHAVKFMDKEEALQEMKQEVQDIDFIISDAEPIQSGLTNEEAVNRPRRELCVYALT
ncbi:MAG: hypothetical protein K9J81_03025 [Desulfohalobiaceae bacterium]|nr:hypothetical protein [Desulfohalobiaceae bacterium]